MLEEAHRKDHAAQHPNVGFGVDFVFEISVNHFGRSVHHCCVFFEFVEYLFFVLGGAFRTVWVEDLSAR